MTLDTRYDESFSRLAEAIENSEGEALAFSLMYCRIVNSINCAALKLDYDNHRPFSLSRVKIKMFFEKERWAASVRVSLSISIDDIREHVTKSCQEMCDDFFLCPRAKERERESEGRKECITQSDERAKVNIFLFLLSFSFAQQMKENIEAYQIILFNKTDSRLSACASC